jgi:LysR family transcriptional regulator, nitrogen assimilation regulatory protein
VNLRQLESFVRVAELGSFSKAARVLDIAQPALSRQVRLLETDLRETLLLRNGRGVALTPSGRRLFEHGVQILQQVAQARADLGAQRDAPVGQVTIGLPPSIGRRLTQPLIEAFRAQMPQARVTIVEGLSAHIAEWIASGRADLGLIYNPEPSPALEITPLLREPLCLVQPRQRGSKKAPPATVALRDLAGVPLIVPERHQSLRRLLESQATLCGVPLAIRARCRASRRSSTWCARAWATRCCTPVRWPRPGALASWRCGASSSPSCRACCAWRSRRPSRRRR